MIGMDAMHSVTDPLAAISFSYGILGLRWWNTLMGLLILGVAYYFYRKIRNLLELRRECTIEVSAVVTAIRVSRSVDGTFGGRGKFYCADYRYEYNDMVYESRSSLYGRPSIQPVAGEVVTISIDPFDPERLFDVYTRSAMHFYMMLCAIYIASGLVMIVMQFID